MIRYVLYDQNYTTGENMTIKYSYEKKILIGLCNGNGDYEHFASSRLHATIAVQSKAVPNEGGVLYLPSTIRYDAQELAGLVFELEQIRAGTPNLHICASDKHLLGQGGIEQIVVPSFPVGDVFQK
ncbi:hypothetical protein J4460_04515 [Candidatus Woesearchaeota archaeon]|nr:hypothetical protein [Candidatus Woesearchaeota archaeon]HIH37586.1 hypothetical protein [Candidatus Woesearchaeota archaeon]